MNNMLRLVLSVLFAAFAVTGWARSDIRDGNAMVKPAKQEKFSIDGFTLGKAELYGYIADLRDSRGITGIVLKRGGSDEQRRIIGSIARTLEIKAFEQEGRELKPIDLPAETPAPPAIESPAPEAAAGAQQP